MNQEQSHLRLNRTVLLIAGAAYLGWWLFVHLALPGAFNPFVSRAVVVACFLAAFVASLCVASCCQRSRHVARPLLRPGDGPLLLSLRPKPCRPELDDRQLHHGHGGVRCAADREVDPSLLALRGGAVRLP